MMNSGPREKLFAIPGFPNGERVTNHNASCWCNGNSAHNYRPILLIQGVLVEMPKAPKSNNGSWTRF